MAYTTFERGHVDRRFWALGAGVAGLERRIVESDCSVFVVRLDQDRRKTVVEWCRS